MVSHISSHVAFPLDTPHDPPWTDEHVALQAGGQCPPGVGSELPDAYWQLRTGPNNPECLAAQLRVTGHVCQVHHALVDYILELIASPQVQGCAYHALQAGFATGQAADVSSDNKIPSLGHPPPHTGERERTAEL